MSNKKPMTLTSVKVKSDLFENFKIECVKRKFSFQKLADRSLYIYILQTKIFVNKLPIKLILNLDEHELKNLNIFLKTKERKFY